MMMMMAICLAIYMRMTMVDGGLGLGGSKRDLMQKKRRKVIVLV
jgi:hypothetical protein